MNKISLATSAFNVTSNNFDLIGAITNWSNYVDEIVIATMPSNDDTYSILEDVKNGFDMPIQIIYNDDDVSKPGWDGRLKNSSHQASSHEVVAQIDLDERMGGDPKGWKHFASQLLENQDNFKSIMIPSINLWGSYFTYADYGFKWYLAVKEGTKRGVVNFAKLDNGLFDRNKSDSCELTDLNGDLMPMANALESSGIKNVLEYCKGGNPFVWHLGYVNLSRRADINRKFWKNAWDSYCDEESNVKTDEEDLQREVFEHGIKINF